MATTDRDERIRERAHALWVEGGRQDGHHERDWERATREIDAAAEKPARKGRGAPKEDSNPVSPAAKPAAKPRGKANVASAGEVVDEGKKETRTKTAASVSKAKTASAGSTSKGAASGKPTKSGKARPAS